MAVIQTNTDILTYADLVNSLCDAYGVDRTGLNERHARSAVRYAYRELPARHQWNYYTRQRLLQTVAEYSTGTVVFDFTGGAHERMLTLTTGTWPSWAAYGRVILDSVHYEVADRKSDSIITLSETSNPGADVSSTTYTLYRNSYPLPVNFGVMLALWDVGSQCRIHFVDSRDQHTALQAFYSDPSTPVHGTVRATGKYLGGQEIIFGPPPSSLLTYDMLYQAHPRPLTIDAYSAGTVATTADSTTVTGTSTTFPTNCVGSIIRFSGGPVKPSGPLGNLDGADNPFTMQGVIKTRTNATSLELEEAATVTASGVAFTISDPLDIDSTRMLSALQRLAEAEFARLGGKQDQNVREARAREAILRAMENDNFMDTERVHTSRATEIGRATVTSE